MNPLKQEWQQEVKEEIHTAAQDIVKQLHETERQLTEEVNKAVEIKVGNLNEQVKSVESALDQLAQNVCMTPDFVLC